MAKLSIATPTFGTPKYLESCIDSVVNQSIDTIHIVCGGNLKFYKKYDTDNVNIIVKNPDPGMVTCWESAASLAKTEYIGFIADDNTFEPSYAETMTSFLDAHPECDLVFCNQTAMDSVGNIDFKKSKGVSNFFGRSELKEGVINDDQYEMILKMNAIPLEACVIRKSVWDKYGPFKQESKGSFDQEFLYRMLISGIKVGYIPKYLMNFRWHNDAYSARARREHLIGSIWTSESLMNQNKKYAYLFKQRNTILKGQLLRCKLKPGERFNIIVSLFFKKDGLKYIVKNTIAKMIGKS